MADKLYRSQKEKMIAGVCGGLAEYFHVDVTLIRLIAIVITFAGGAGILAYLVGIVLIPKNPDQDWHNNGYQRQNSHDNGINTNRVHDVLHEAVENLEEAAETIGKSLNFTKESKDNKKNEPFRDSEETTHNRSKLAGLALIVIGVFFFLDRLFPLWFNMSRMWPVILIIIGGFIIWRGDRR